MVTKPIEVCISIYWFQLFIHIFRDGLTHSQNRCNSTGRIEIYPKISLLPMLSQISTIASFVKVKISDIQTRFHNE